MGELIRATDWSKTPLGDPSTWSQSLQTTVAMVMDNPFGMYIAWGKEYIQLYNDGYRPILGSTKHPQALGISTRETFSEIWHIIGPMFDGVMEGKAVGFPDFMLPLNRNGYVEECFFDFSYSPIRKDDGEVGGVLVTVIETTNKKKSEDALKESEDRFRTMAEGSDILIALSDVTSNATYFNKAWTDFTGRSVDELMKFGWADLIHPEDKQPFLDIYISAFNKQESWTGEFRMQNKNGDYKWLLARGPARHNADGSFIGYISSSIDITDQVVAHKRIEENEQELISMVSQAPIGICVMDAATLVSETVNEKFIEIAGKPYDEIVGKHYWETFSEAKPYYEEALNEVIKTGKPFYANEVPVVLIRHGKKETMYVTFVYALLKGIDDNAKKIAVWVLDNTQQVKERKRTEESEEEIRSLVDSAPFPIGVYRGREMHISLANQSIMDIWGKGNDVVGKLYRDILPELHNQQIFQQLDDVFMTGKAFHNTNQRIDLMVDGVNKTYYFNYSFTPLFDKNGKVYGVMNTAADVTDLNVTKQKVEQSEKNFRNMILQAPVAMCILMGPQHVIEVANDFMIEIWGKKKEDVLNKPVFDALPDARGQGLEEIMANAYLKGETFKAYDTPVALLRNGKEETVYQDFVYEPYRDSDGTILGVLAISVDVSAQVLARKKIEEAEQKTRLAINSAELGVYEIIYSTDEMITDDRFKEIWGVDHSVTRNEYAAAIHPDDMLHRAEAHKQSLSSGQLDYQARVIWKDKSIHWVRVTGTVIYDDHKDPLKLIGVIQDVTQLVIAQKKIEDSERNLRNMILQAPVAMCILKGPEHVIELANERMIEVWGKKPEELLNKPVMKALPEIEGEGFDILLNNVYNSGEAFIGNELPVTLTRDGKPQIVFCNFVYEAYREPDGSVSGILVVASDVTAQVIARHKIEEVVSERTKELADANSNLQKSNSELAQFAYIASHDLQEPLRKISIFSEMLENSLGDQLNEQAKNYLGKINASSLRMNRLIRDVLSYSELVKDNDAFEQVDLNKVIENTKHDYDLLMEQKGATLVYKNLPVIEAIPLQMSQLLGNLLGNALKFTKKDVKPVITITTQKVTTTEINTLSLKPEVEYVNIQFADNGIGFLKEHAEQIFSIFQRLHKKSEFEGTGIGLAMCKKIALNHHGNIHANASSQNGAVFNVILPVKQMKQ